MRIIHGALWKYPMKLLFFLHGHNVVESLVWKLIFCNLESVPKQLIIKIREIPYK